MLIEIVLDAKYYVEANGPFGTIGNLKWESPAELFIRICPPFAIATHT